MISLNRQIEELWMIRCSLLPGEHLIFLDSFPNTIRDNNNPNDEPQEEEIPEGSETESSKWDNLLAINSTTTTTTFDHMNAMSPARFRLTVDQAKVLFEVDCQGYNGECDSINECISINGDNLSRMIQERLRERIKESLDQVEREATGGGYPLYELISTYLLPILHETIEDEEGNTINRETSRQAQSPKSKIYHVLFTSHHLISSTKRRNLQNWSSDLKLSGFTKIGYPGIIYAQGWKDEIEEFVGNVKAMQWLALKVRFFEEELENEGSSGTELSGWKEFGKVGEVVEEMRRLGRGKYIVEMGIGSGTRD